MLDGTPYITLCYYINEVSMHYPIFEKIIERSRFRHFSSEEQRNLYGSTFEAILEFKPELAQLQNIDMLSAMLNEYESNGVDVVDTIERDFSMLHQYCILLPSHINNTLPLRIMPHCHKLIMNTNNVEVYFLCISMAHIINELPVLEEETLSYLISLSIPFVREGKHDYDHPWAFLIFLRKHSFLIYKNKALVTWIFSQLRSFINQRLNVTDITTECIDPLLTFFSDEIINDDDFINIFEGFFSLVQDLNSEFSHEEGDRNALLKVGIRLIIEANEAIVKEKRFDEILEASEKIVLELRHVYYDLQGDRNHLLGEAGEKVFQMGKYSLTSYKPEEIAYNIIKAAL